MFGRKPRRIRSQNAPQDFNHESQRNTSREFHDEVISIDDDSYEGGESKNTGYYGNASEYERTQNNRRDYIDIEPVSNMDRGDNRRIRLDYDPNSQQSLETVLEYANSGLVGVFGMNSDTVLNNVFYRIGIRLVVECPNYRSPNDDIYNIISAGLLQSILEWNSSSRNTYYMTQSMDYQYKQLLQKLNSLYRNPNDEYDYDYSPLVKLRSMGENRGQKLIDALQLAKSMLQLGRNRNIIVRIPLEMGVINYKLLKILSSIQTENVIYVVTSLEPSEVAGRMVEASAYGNYHYFMEKYFGLNRIFEFNN